MITALAIMIAIAGYLQFAGTNLEKEYLATLGHKVVAVGMVVADHAMLALLVAAAVMETPHCLFQIVTKQ